jgi:hypothetical protein
MADEKVNLISTKREKREKSDPKTDKKDEPVRTQDGAKDPGNRDNAREPAKDPVEKAIEPAEEFPSSTPGAIIRVKIDRSHWLGFGYGETTTVMVDSNRIYTLLKLDKGTNVAIYLPEDKMLVSGFMWEDARKQLPNKAYLMHSPSGRGHIIAFAEDPNYRVFMEGLNLMVMNAVFLGPGH